MPNVITGEAEVAEGTRFAIVAARFHRAITEKLLAGALEAIARRGGDPEATDVYWVPGSFEVPLLARRLAEGGRHDAVICLGAVIRGETAHFEYVAAAAARGVAEASLGSGVPVIFGILTTENVRQAEARTGEGGPNRGAEAAEAAIEMVNLLKKLS